MRDTNSVYATTVGGNLKTAYPEVEPGGFLEEKKFIHENW